MIINVGGMKMFTRHIKRFFRSVEAGRGPPGTEKKDLFFLPGRSKPFSAVFPAACNIPLRIIAFFRIYRIIVYFPSVLINEILTVRRRWFVHIVT